jgi:hypothetical protein
MSTVREHLGLLWLLRRSLAATNPQYDGHWAYQASHFVGVHLNELIEMAGGADIEDFVHEHFPEVPADFPYAKHASEPNSHGTAVEAAPSATADEGFSEGVAGEPVAWYRQTDITEWTDSEPETDGWTPLYATPQAAPSLPATALMKLLNTAHDEIVYLHKSVMQNHGFTDNDGTNNSVAVEIREAIAIEALLEAPQSKPASTAAQAAPQITDEQINTTEEARMYLQRWFIKQAKNRTFNAYIWDDLAGDFAYVLARALLQTKEQN